MMLQIWKINVDGGGWVVLKKYFDSNSDWHREEIDLSAYDESTIQLRFRLVTNASDPAGYTFDGWVN